MNCSNCGSEYAPGAKFCSNCGVQLDPASDVTTTFAVISEQAFDMPPLEGQLAAENAMLYVRLGTGDASRFLISKDVTTVGRHPESDIFLNDITVSRHHAKFVRANGNMYLEDLGSLNGTYINRTLIDGRALLRAEDEIQIGKYRATIVFGDSGAA